MRALAYFFSEAAASLWRARGSALMAIVTIAAGVFALGVFLLANANLQRLAARWSESAELSIYLSEEATAEQVQAVEAAIDRSGIASERQYVSKDEALTHFRSDFPDLAGASATLADNPFPASIEVRLRSNIGDDTTRVQALVGSVRELDGVADVRYDAELLGRLHGIVRGVRMAGIAVVLILSLAAALTVANVVRLTAVARRDEIEIMQLVGAPFIYVRGPFVAEGILQGGMGAAIAMALLAAGFLGLRAQYPALTFLPPAFVVLLVLGGMGLGCLGGYIAARQVR